MVALNVNLLIGAFFTSNSDLDKKYIQPISYSLNLAEWYIFWWIEGIMWVSNISLRLPVEEYISKFNFVTVMRLESTTT